MEFAHLYFQQQYSNSRALKVNELCDLSIGAQEIIGGYLVTLTNYSSIMQRSAILYLRS